MRRCGAATLFAAALALLAPAAQAATFDLEYDASILNVVKLGSVSLRGTVAGGQYQAAASMQTAGLAQSFDDTRISARASGVVGANGALGWSRYDLSHAYGKKARRVSMRRAGTSVSAEITPDYRTWGVPPASAAQKAGSFDPLSGLVTLALSVGKAGGCATRVRVFDGKTHYALALAPMAKGNYRGGGYDGPATVCRLSFVPIAGFDKIPKAGPGVEVWFAKPTADGFAAPLRISAPTPVGEGRIDLRRYQVR